MPRRIVTAREQAEMASPWLRLAVPAIDAYDDEPEMDDYLNPIPGTEKYPMDIRREDQEIQEGPWYHATDQELAPGHILLPSRTLGPSLKSYDRGDQGNHADWVWMSRHPGHARSFVGPEDHLYEVQPLDEGPWEWNQDIFTNPGEGGRYVAPRARIIRKITGSDMNIRNQVNKANQRAQDARRAGDHDRADYLEYLRDLMLQRHSEGQERPWSHYEPMADEEFGDRLAGAREEFEKGYRPDPTYVPSTQDILNPQNRPSHGYDYIHDAEGGPLHSLRRRDFYPGPKEMPIYDTQTGEPTGRHFTVGEPIGPITKGYEPPPEYLHPTQRLNRTSAAHPRSHPDLHESFARHGSVHTTGGRVIPGWRTAASQAEQEARLAEPTGWGINVNFPPVASAVQGARSYASKVGLPDPHQIDYTQIRRTPDSVRNVGRHYDSLPEHDPSAAPYYDAMRREVNNQYDHLTNTMGIHVQPMDHDPYSDVHEMINDVANNKRLQVMGTHVTGPHQFFDNDTNDKFRAVHDFFGHAATGRSFDRHGEQAAYLAHAQMFSPHALPALASETRGQNSSLILNGNFPAQKLAVMDPQHYAFDLSNLNRAARRKLAAVLPRYIILPHWDPEAVVEILLRHHLDMLGEQDHTARRRIALPQITPELMEMARKGGFSLRDHIGDAPTNGYMVSVDKDGEDMRPISTLTADHVRDFVNANADRLNMPGHYLGGWLEAGNFYLDVSKHHPDIYAATSAAVRDKQLGIYDLANERTLNTDDAGRMIGHPGIVGRREHGQRAGIPHSAQGQRRGGSGHHAGGGGSPSAVREPG